MERVEGLIGPCWREESTIGLSCLLDTSIYMGCQLLRDSDAVSMAHSLELRVPLVDLRVAEFARSCADEFKLEPDGGNGLAYGASGAKRVLIHALRDLLPPDIGRRPKKGFGLPHDDWARHDLAPLIQETCSRESIASAGLLDPDLLGSLASDGSGGRIWYGWPQAWSILILELWRRSIRDLTEFPVDRQLIAAAPAS
jgi:asparagine synthase (glutamine-hydrolysing)